MIGLLNCYRQSENAPSYQMDYEPMMLNFLKSALPNETVKVYRVPLGELPIRPGECAGWIISGSPKGAYDGDDWIANLGKFIVAADAAKTKLVGICFGHQLIAHTLGGRAEKSSKGWGVGVQDFTVTDFQPWMQPHLKKAALLFSHQDQVVQLPPKAKHLASSEFCRYQMFSLREHIFSMQGHPEFTPEFARGRLDSRKEIIGEQVYQTAVSTLQKPTTAPELGRWIQQFLSRP